MSENVVQPGIEPGSPDYRSDALTTLNHAVSFKFFSGYLLGDIFYTFSAIRITSLLPRSIGGGGGG